MDIEKLRTLARDGAFEDDEDLDGGGASGAPEGRTALSELARLLDTPIPEVSERLDEAWIKLSGEDVHARGYGATQLITLIIQAAMEANVKPDTAVLPPGVVVKPATFPPASAASSGAAASVVSTYKTPAELAKIASEIAVSSGVSMEEATRSIIALKDAAERSESKKPAYTITIDPPKVGEDTIKRLVEYFELEKPR